MPFLGASFLSFPAHIPVSYTHLDVYKRQLLYLSRFTQREKFHEATDFYAWKGYDFDILNELDDADYILSLIHI